MRSASRPSLPVVSVILRIPGLTFGALLVALSISLGGSARADVLSWVPTGLTGVEVTDVVIDPDGSGRIWAATLWRGLLVSTDGGKTFVPSPAAGLDPRVTGIDFDPQDPSVLYAATEGGLYRVAAATAERLWPRDLREVPNARWVSVDPLDPRVLLIGTNGGAISRSGDRGVTWKSTGVGGHPYRDSGGRAFFDSSRPGVVLAMFDNAYLGARLVRSTDHGATWSYPEPVQAGSSRSSGVLSVDAEHPGEVYLAQFVYFDDGGGEAPTFGPTHLVSRDFGLTWSPLAPSNLDAIGPLVVLPSGAILSVGNGGVFRTDGAAGPWVLAIVGLPAGSRNRFLALDADGQELLLATSAGLFRTEPCPDTSPRTALLPSLVDAFGLAGARFQTSLTLFNASDGMAEGVVEYVASAAAGATGSGSFPLRLRAREQVVVTDASKWLRDAGLDVPEATPGQPQVGTVTFRTADGLWGGEVVAVARVTTPSGAGRSGTGLWSLPASSLLTSTAYLPGLRETAAERTNVALVNGGATGRITLRVTFRHAGGAFAREAALGPGQWVQWNAPLAQEGVERADAVVERIAGDEPFAAYATLVDAVTNDGSFLPARDAPTAGQLWVPAVVEANGFETEVVLHNTEASDATASLVFTDSLDPAPGGLAPLPAFVVTVPARGSVILPRVVDAMRQGGIPIGPSTVSHAGLLRVEATAAGRPAALLASARTTIPAAGGGSYGVSYPALSESNLARSEAWVAGLGPSRVLVRSNLAFLNPGSEPVTLEWKPFFNNPLGGDAGLGGSVTLQPGEWKQFPLEDYNAVVRVRKLSGPGPFGAYGVVNDGRSPGLGTGDGTYTPMSATR